MCARIAKIGELTVCISRVTAFTDQWSMGYVPTAHALVDLLFYAQMVYLIVFSNLNVVLIELSGKLKEMI